MNIDIKRDFNFLSFLPVDTMMQVAGIAMKHYREMGYDDSFFKNTSWYSRVLLPEEFLPADRSKDLDAELSKLSKICNEPDFRKHLTVSVSDQYSEEDCARIISSVEKFNFKQIKLQRGMIFDLEDTSLLNKANASNASDPHIIEIPHKAYEEILSEWCDTCEKGFNKTDMQIPMQHFNTLPEFHHYAYVADGKIVATTMLHLDNSKTGNGDIVHNGGIYEVTTLPEYRKKGIAHELIKHMIREGLKYGCDLLSLQASVYGEPVYKSLGFKNVSKIYTYK